MERKSTAEIEKKSNPKVMKLLRRKVDDEMLQF